MSSFLNDKFKCNAWMHPKIHLHIHSTLITHANNELKYLKNEVRIIFYVTNCDGTI